MNNNKTMASKLWDSKQRGKFLAVSAFFGKEESLKISALTFHFKNKNDSKLNKRKQREENYRAEINEIEGKCIIEFYKTTSKAEQNKQTTKKTISEVDL